MDIIHSTSHFNKKPKFAFLERGGGKKKLSVFGMKPVEQLGPARGWPPASPFPASV